MRFEVIGARPSPNPVGIPPFLIFSYLSLIYLNFGGQTIIYQRGSIYRGW